MYDEYYGLKTDPFRLTPTGNRVFYHPSYRKSLDYLDYALHRREGIVLIIGPPGSGKTSLIKAAKRSAEDSEIHMSVLSCNKVNSEDFIRLYAAELGIELDNYDTGTAILSIIEELKRIHNAGKHSVLILDEAQSLSVGELEQARLLTNHQAEHVPLVQLVLVGHQALQVKVLSPELTQLHQRITSSTILNFLNVDETRDYFLHRLTAAGWNANPKFEDDIYHFLYTASAGIPRCINHIGSRLLLNGCLEKRHTIGVEDIKQVISDMSKESLLPNVMMMGNNSNSAENVESLSNDLV